MSLRSTIAETHAILVALADEWRAGPRKTQEIHGAGGRIVGNVSTGQATAKSSSGGRKTGSGKFSVSDKTHADPALQAFLDAKRPRGDGRGTATVGISMAAQAAAAKQQAREDDANFGIHKGDIVRARHDISSKVQEYTHGQVVTVHKNGDATVHFVSVNGVKHTHTTMRLSKDALERSHDTTINELYRKRIAEYNATKATKSTKATGTKKSAVGTKVSAKAKKEQATFQQNYDAQRNTTENLASLSQESQRRYATGSTAPHLVVARRDAYNAVDRGSVERPSPSGSSPLPGATREVQAQFEEAEAERLDMWLHHGPGRFIGAADTNHYEKMIARYQRQAQLLRDPTNIPRSASPTLSLLATRLRLMALTRVAHPDPPHGSDGRFYSAGSASTSKDPVARDAAAHIRTTDGTPIGGAAFAAHRESEHLRASLTKLAQLEKTQPGIKAAAQWRGHKGYNAIANHRATLEMAAGKRPDHQTVRDLQALYHLYQQRLGLRGTNDPATVRQVVKADSPSAARMRRESDKITTYLARFGLPADVPAKQRSVILPPAQLRDLRAAVDATLAQEQATTQRDTMADVLRNFEYADSAGNEHLVTQGSGGKWVNNQIISRVAAGKYVVIQGKKGKFEEGQVHLVHAEHHPEGGYHVQVYHAYQALDHQATPTQERTMPTLDDLDAIVKNYKHTRSFDTFDAAQNHIRSMPIPYETRIKFRAKMISDAKTNSQWFTGNKLKRALKNIASLEAEQRKDQANLDRLLAPKSTTSTKKSSGPKSGAKSKATPARKAPKAKRLFALGGYAVLRSQLAAITA